MIEAVNLFAENPLEHGEVNHKTAFGVDGPLDRHGTPGNCARAAIRRHGRGR